MKFKRLFLTAAATAALLMGSAAQAGPFILAGTDADDHGSVSGGVNQNGWEFMQKSLQFLAPGVTTGNKKVTILGSTGFALTAASSAFNLSTLVGAGWTVQTISVGNFNTFFGAGGNLGTGILMMDSGGNVGGGVAGSNFNPHSAAIDAFLGAGGALFSQANGYSWLSTLVPGLSVINESGSLLSVTPAGTAAFPGLSNADLSSGPWHNTFLNTGSLSVFATAADVGASSFGRAVVIGGATGSITNPGNVPEPASLALVALALAAAGTAAKRKRA